MFRQWPLLSIHITSATKRTGFQQVRYEGGIEDTQLGADLFRVDLDLKPIILGVLADDPGRARHGMLLATCSQFTVWENISPVPLTKAPCATASPWSWYIIQAVG